MATCLDLDVSDHDHVIAFCRHNDISLVVVGPEAPLVAGIADDLRAVGIRCLGPSAAAARLEGSKAFTKDFLARHGIPTAAYANFTELQPALDYLRQQGAPIVVKADGLAAGKGVIVAATIEEAETAIDDIMVHKTFGGAGDHVVIEDAPDGDGSEVTTHTMTADDTATFYAVARDSGDNFVSNAEVTWSWDGSCTDLGGLGGGAYDIYRVSEDMAAIDLGIATGVLATFLGTDPINVGGTPQQKAEWLGELAEKGQFYAYGATEPQAGSDLGALTTKAEPVEKDGKVVAYRISGRKQWISNGGVADR